MQVYLTLNTKKCSFDPLLRYPLVIKYIPLTIHTDHFVAKIGDFSCVLFLIGFVLLLFFILSPEETIKIIIELLLHTNGDMVF